MAFTKRTADWYDENRYRSYPFRNDEGLVIKTDNPETWTGVELTRAPNCVLLGATVVDTRTEASEDSDCILKCSRYVVSEESTSVFFSYSGKNFSFSLVGGEMSGDEAFQTISGELRDEAWSRPVKISLTFSSHAFILSRVPLGTYKFSGTVLPSRVIILPTGSGVDGIVTNGSAKVQGGGVATGTVVLEDGFRTSPVVHNGNVRVRIGPAYGKDPCHYDSGSPGNDPCDEFMFFFCGQNAVNSGNIVMRGGSGVSVTQGRMYVVKKEIPDGNGGVAASVGEAIPCIEISATTPLMNLYLPPGADSSSPSNA